jgi:phage-related protein
MISPKQRVKLALEAEKTQKKIENIQKAREKAGMKPLIFGRNPKKYINGVWQ